MEFRTPLPYPPGASTLAEVMLYWELDGHHKEAERLAALIAAAYRESSSVAKEGQCNCPCGCTHVFQEGDCQLVNKAKSSQVLRSRVINQREE